MQTPPWASLTLSRRKIVYPGIFMEQFGIEFLSQVSVINPKSMFWRNVKSEISSNFGAKDLTLVNNLT